MKNKADLRQRSAYRLKLAAWFPRACCIFALSLVYGCSPESTSEPKAANSKVDIETPQDIVNLDRLNQQARRRFAHYHSEKLASLADQVAVFDRSIQAFLDTPNPATLEHAQAEWLTLDTALASLYALELISDTQNTAFKLGLARSLYRLNAQPIQPGTLDRFGDYPYSGLVYDLGFTLSRENLLQQHGRTHSEEVVLGAHAIEFMLFGENKQRSADDYTAITALSTEQGRRGMESVDDAHQNRRRQLLALQTEQLSADVAILISDLASKQGKTLLSRVASEAEIRAALYRGLDTVISALSQRLEKHTAQNEQDSSAQDQFNNMAVRLESIAVLSAVLPRQNTSSDKLPLDQALTQIADKFAALNQDNQDSADEEATPSPDKQNPTEPLIKLRDELVMLRNMGRDAELSDSPADKQQGALTPQ